RANPPAPPNPHASGVTNRYSASNNTRCQGNGFPSTGVTTDCDPDFIDPANGNSRQANGRGVWWRLADQPFGPGTSDNPDPYPDTTPPNTMISSAPSGSTS